MSKSSNYDGNYYFCFYHVLHENGHKHYHHVIIKTKDTNSIKILSADTYQYYLMSTEMLYLTNKDRGLSVIRGLIMDGESLLKRLKKQNKNF